MGLRDLKLPETKIETPDGDFTVRGISLADLTILASTYMPQMVLIFNKVKDGADIEQADVRRLIGELAPAVPEMVAAIIALAADEFDEKGVENAGKLGFNVQIETLEAIFHNTFRSEAEVKKLVESITRMLVGATGAIQQIRLPLSELGFGESAGK